MTAGLSTPTVSTRAVLLPFVTRPGSLRDLTRRVSRTATLDGGAVLTDQGFADADRTLVLTCSATAELAAAVEYLVRTYPTVVVSVDVGCFLAALSAITYQNETLQLTALVHSRLSEA